MRQTSTGNKPPRAMARMPLTAAICVALGGMAFAGTALAQQAEDEQPSLDTITVTAQKRTEKAQDVPISLNVIGQQQLDELQVNDFEDYAKLLPSVSITPLGPGFGQVYMRGVVSGGDGNHSASAPSVGVYLDEQPITTIQGALDLHVYDIERVEALSGPQGTLYGASSESGTLKIVTRKPDPSGFAAGYGLEANSVNGGGIGHVAEGFVNIPMSDSAAIRLVGWQKRDAGWIDNVRGTRTYPTSGIVDDNFDRARDDYNVADTVGARLAARFDLGEHWTITPTVMGQRQESKGSWSYDTTIGRDKIMHAYPESADDRWTQAALTVQGKIGNFDLTYAFAHLKRDVDSESDYSDYGFWYDTLAGYGAYFYDDNGDLVNPAQYIQAKDGYRKTSHELRIASPQDQRFRFVGGLFWTQHFHDIEQRYRIDDLASLLSVRGWEDTIWLTKQERRDKDRAIFGEVSFDFTDKLTATAGFRHFRNENSLKGFFGFSDGYFPQTGQPVERLYGQAACIDRYGSDPNQWPSFNGAPCTVFDKTLTEKGTLGKFNLAYKPVSDKMLYFTWSEGYRPGGINRRGILPPYLTEYLTNYEVGWKTAWMGNRLTFNGAAFHQVWDDFQFPVLGLNGLTEIRNANQARIQGLEMDVNWAATYNLKLSAGIGLYNAELTENYCGEIAAGGKPITDCASPLAPEGTRLPVTADYKGNVNARYTFDIGSFEAYWQGSFVYEGRRTSDLRLEEREILGSMPAYSLFDMSVGIRKDNWSVDLYIKNLFDENAQYNRYVQCPERVCGNRPDGLPVHPVPAQYANGQVYAFGAQPRTIGIKFSQEF